MAATPPALRRRPGFPAREPGSAASEGWRVVVVKWDRLHGEFLQRLVADTWPAAEIVVFHTGEAALAALRRRPAHLGILGLTFPDVDGLDLLATIGDEKLVGRLLVLTGRRDERARQALRSARFTGYFDTETEGVAELHEALRKVEAGQFYVSRSFGLPVSEHEKDGTALARLLSPTEMQVFAVLGDGCDDQEAAEQLALSPATVHSHRQHIMHKIGVRTRTELMRAAIDRGVIRITRGHIIRPGFERALTARKAAAPLLLER